MSGSMVSAAVKELQAQMNRFARYFKLPTLAVDGVVGKNTRTLLQTLAQVPPTMDDLQGYAPSADDLNPETVNLLITEQAGDLAALVKAQADATGLPTSPKIKTPTAPPADVAATKAIAKNIGYKTSSIPWVPIAVAGGIIGTAVLVSRSLK